MRTTVNISGDLLVEAKVVAARRGCTLGSVFDDALRSSLLENQRIELLTSGNAADTPLVDVADRDALAEALGDNDLVSVGTGDC